MADETVSPPVRRGRKISMTLSNSSAEAVLNLTTEPIARGRERSCYMHPDDASKLVKVSRGPQTTQNRREIALFEDLIRRGITEYGHLPRYYGAVDTNLGPGLVVELIRDHDGSISKPLRWYIDNGMPREEVELMFEALRSFLLRNLVIFNHDLTSGNMLLRRSADDSAALVIIDGLGDVTLLSWLNRLPSHARAKIARRWDRLMTRFYRNHFVDETRGEKS